MSDATYVAWAATAINYDDSRLSKVVMHSQMAMASGRRWRGLLYQWWSDTLKASMTFADFLPIRTGPSTSLAKIGRSKDLTSELVMKFKNMRDHLC